MWKTGSLSLLALVLSLLACDNEISSASRLLRPRLLAVQAEPPNPGFGQSTQLRPLVYLPPGETVTYEWSWCPVPTTPDNGYRCPVDQVAVDTLATRAGLRDLPPLLLGTTETVTFTNSFPADLLASLCAGDSATTNLFFGGSGTDERERSYNCAIATLPVQIMLTIRGSITDTGVVSLRLPIDDITPGNVNPVITGIHVVAPGPERTLDDTGLVTVPRDTKVKLHAGVEQDQAELYLDRQMGPNGEYLRDSSGAFVIGPVAESLMLSWFSEGGGFVKQHTWWSASEVDDNGLPVSLLAATENDWTTPKVEDDAAASSLVLVIVQDGRGGVAWTQARASLEVAP